MQYLTMPADFRLGTLEAYSALNRNGYGLSVRETYGNLNPSPVELGSGRTSRSLPGVSRDELAAYVAESRRLGLEFNYTFNSPCTGNMEFTTRGARRLLDFFESLTEIGITNFTLTAPSLISLVKGHFPDVRVTVSTIAGIESVSAARAFVAMGADRIVLGEDILRRFDVLRAIAGAVRAPLEVIVNTRCLYLCPYKMYDYSYLSHCGSAARINDIADYYKWLCTSALFSDPVEWLKMRWIRPEDLHLYDFVTYFKVIGRQLVGTSELPRAAETYMRGRYDGNLLELLGNFSPRRAEFYPVHLENGRLDGFVEWFAKDPRNCREKGCEGCAHCRRYAGEALDGSTLGNVEQALRGFQSRLDDFHVGLRTRPVGPDEILLNT